VKVQYFKQFNLKIQSQGINHKRPSNSTRFFTTYCVSSRTSYHQTVQWRH